MDAHAAARIEQGILSINLRDARKIHEDFLAELAKAEADVVIAREMAITVDDTGKKTLDAGVFGDCLRAAGSSWPRDVIRRAASQPNRPYEVLTPNFRDMDMEWQIMQRRAAIEAEKSVKFFQQFGKTGSSDDIFRFIFKHGKEIGSAVAVHQALVDVYSQDVKTGCTPRHYGLEPYALYWDGRYTTTMLDLLLCEQLTGKFGKYQNMIKEEVFKLDRGSFVPDYRDVETAHAAFRQRASDLIQSHIKDKPNCHFDREWVADMVEHYATECGYGVLVWEEILSTPVDLRYLPVRAIEGKLVWC